MDLSIIVPVYNTELYLRRCLDSILEQQTFFNFEIIIVNDGSTDGSSKIIKEYSSGYKNIKSIEFALNKSLSVARSVGIKNAIGKYIMHIDSDDWIMPNTIDKLLNTLKKNEVDVIVFNFLRHNGNKNISKSYLIKKEVQEFNDHNKYLIQNLFMGSCINKIVKRVLLNDLVYGSRYMNSTEDLIYSFEVFLKSRKILVINDVLYVYFHNIKSITNTSNPDKYLRSQIITYDSLSQIVQNYCVSEKYNIAINNYLDKFLQIEIFNNHFSRIIGDETFYKMLNSYKNYNNNNALEIDLYYKSFLKSCIIVFKNVDYFTFIKMAIKGILKILKLK